MWRDRYLICLLEGYVYKTRHEKQIIIATASFSCCQRLASESKFNLRIRNRIPITINAVALRLPSKPYTYRNNEPEIGIIVKGVFALRNGGKKVGESLNYIFDPESSGVDGELCQTDKKDANICPVCTEALLPV